MVAHVRLRKSPALPSLPFLAFFPELEWPFLHSAKFVCLAWDQKAGVCALSSLLRGPFFGFEGKPKGNQPFVGVAHTHTHTPNQNLPTASQALVVWIDGMETGWFPPVSRNKKEEFKSPNHQSKLVTCLNLRKSMTMKTHPIRRGSKCLISQLPTSLPGQNANLGPV